MKPKLIHWACIAELVLQIYTLDIISDNTLLNDIIASGNIFSSNFWWILHKIWVILRNKKKSTGQIVTSEHNFTFFFKEIDLKFCNILSLSGHLIFCDFRQNSEIQMKYTTMQMLGKNMWKLDILQLETDATIYHSFQDNFRPQSLCFMSY